MKQNNLLTTMLLLFALIVGSTSAWAQSEETITIASFSNESNEGWTITNAEYATAGGGYYKLISSDASIVTPNINWSEYSDITITISARKFGGPNATQGKISVSQGETELASYSPSGTSIAASSALDITPTDGNITISCPGASSSKGCGVQSVVIKGKASGGGSSLFPSDLTITDAPVALSFDLYNNSNSQIVRYTTSSTGAVSIADNTYATFAIDETNKTVTVTPTAITPSTQTITINQESDDTYAAGSRTFTITVTDSTPFDGVIFNATTDKGTSPIVKDNVSFACSNGVLNNGTEYRLYKSSTTTISTTDGSIITKIEFTNASSNPASGFGSQTGWTTNNDGGIWEGEAESVSFVASGAQVRATVIKVTVAPNTNPSISAEDVNIAYDATSGSIAYSITNIPDLAGTLTASVSESSWLTPGTVEGTTVPFTCSANETAAARTATVTLTYTYDTDKTVTKNVTVTQAGNPNGPGTENNPYTVAQARAAIDAEVGVKDVYAKGIVSEIVTNYTSNDGISFCIVDNVGDTDYLEAYRCKGAEAANVQVGDEVIVKGDLYYYAQQGIYEFRANCELVSLKNTKPSITVDTYAVEAPADGADGILNVTYKNITNVDAKVYFCDANGDAATYDWVIADINEDNNVEYLIDANEGEARTAYMKVYALDDDANDVYSELITVSQAAYVAPAVPGSWVAAGLADINANDVFVIVGNNGKTYAMSNDNGTSTAPGAVEVTVTGNTLSGDIADNIQWNISGNATDGYTFYPNGDNEKWLYCTSSNNGVRVGTNDNKTFTINSDYLYNVGQARYIGIYGSQDWRCYTSINANIKDQTFTFYKKLAAKLNDYGYATFSATVPVDFSEATDFTAWAINSISGTTITFEQVTGAVPANTGVLLKGKAGSTVYPVAAATGTPVTNMLEAITTATTVTEDQYYGLSGNTFVPVSAGTVPAGKALLPANEVSGARQLTFVFGGETTGIGNLTPTLSEGEGVYYNLAGQRVAQPTKGLYIVNGKKVILK